MLRPSFSLPSLPRDFNADLASGTPSPPVRHAIGSVSLLITTAHDEGGTVVQTIAPGPLPAEAYSSIVAAQLGPERAAILLADPAYAATSDGTDAAGDSVRNALVRLATDAAWRCPSRDIARLWAAHGGTVYVGEWEAGAAYPSNMAPNGWCTGRVCHEVRTELPRSHRRMITDQHASLISGTPCRSAPPGRHLSHVW